MKSSVDDSQDDVVLDTRQAAALLGCSPGTLSNIRAAGRPGPPFFRFGRSVRYLRGQLLAYRARLQQQTGGAA